MDFMFPTTKIFLADQNDVNIAEFSKTLKNKNVNIKIKREEVKIKRGYTYVEKKLLTKQNVKAEFSIICDFAVFKNLFDYTEEVTTLENIRVGFVNGKKFEKFEMYNCNVTIEADINYKYDKESVVTFKIEPQGINGKYFDLLYGRTNTQIKEQGLTNLDLKKYTNWEIKYLSKLER